MNLPTDAPHDSISVHEIDALIHAALCDVPLPAGFMCRVRKLVYDRRESSE